MGRVHVESTRRILDDWKELHATYDIQYDLRRGDGRWLATQRAGQPLGIGSGVLEGREGGNGRGGRAGGGEGVGNRTGGFEWVVHAAPKGAGLKKRKILLRVLIELWAVAVGGEGEELPAVQKRAIYKKMTKTLSVKQVGAELVLLEKAGIVVVEGDGVRCSEIRSAPTKGSRRAGGGVTAGGVDTGRGGRTAVRNKGGSDDESDTGSTGGSRTSQ